MIVLCQQYQAIHRNPCFTGFIVGVSPLTNSQQCSYFSLRVVGILSECEVLAPIAAINFP